MARIGVGIVALAGLLAEPALADCTLRDFEATQFELSAVPPSQLNLALRPVLPECLRGLSGPEQENCPRDEIAAYGAAVETWVAALNGYVIDTHRFANEVTVFANAVIDYANEARTYANAALEFANCEVAAITAASEE